MHFTRVHFGTYVLFSFFFRVLFLFIFFFRFVSRFIDRVTNETENEKIKTKTDKTSNRLKNQPPGRRIKNRLEMQSSSAFPPKFRAEIKIKT